MPTSAATLAKRALVSVILRLAVAYLITLAVNSLKIPHARYNSF